MYASLPAGSAFSGLTETERFVAFIIYAFLLILPFLSIKIKSLLNRKQLYVVLIDWRDRQYPPEILGAYKTEKQALLAMSDKQQGFETDGYTEDDVLIRIETVKM